MTRATTRVTLDQRTPAPARAVGPTRAFFFRVDQIVRVRSLEVLDPPALDVPNPRGHFVNHIVVVRDQQNRPVVFLQRDV